MLRPRFRYPRNCSEVDATPPIQISEELFRIRCYAPDSDIRGTVQKSMLRPRFRYPRNCSEVDATPPIQISEELFRSRCSAPGSDIRAWIGCEAWRRCPRTTRSRSVLPRRRGIVPTGHSSHARRRCRGSGVRSGRRWSASSFQSCRGRGDGS